MIDPSKIHIAEYTHPIVSDEKNLMVPASAKLICREIMRILTTVYPRYKWAIQPDVNGGQIVIFCATFSYEYGYSIRFPSFHDEMDRKKVILIGGEILERFNVSRKGFEKGMLRDTKKDFRGNSISDNS